MAASVWGCLWYVEYDPLRHIIKVLQLSLSLSIMLLNWVKVNNAVHVHTNGHTLVRFPDPSIKPTYKGLGKWPTLQCSEGISFSVNN